MGEKTGDMEQPDEDEVAKRLHFSSPGSSDRESHKSQHHSGNSVSPGQAAKRRDPLHRQGGETQATAAAAMSRKKTGRRRKGGKLGMGLLAALMVWLLCIAGVGVMVWLNWDRYAELSMEDVTKFFSNDPLLEKSQLSRNQLLRRAKPFLDAFGALACSLGVGVIFAAFTCLLMFYDSDDPGHFPPTPVSPRRQGEEELSNTGWHLGYIFAPVNFVVGFSLALIYLRLSLGLPLYPQV